MSEKVFIVLPKFKRKLIFEGFFAINQESSSSKYNNNATTNNHTK